MTTGLETNPFSSLPQVDKVLRNPELVSWERRLLPHVRTSVVQKVIEEARAKIKNGGACPPESELVALIIEKFSELLQPSLRKAINATGIVLHTNLGRAPIPESILKDLAQELSGYCTLEVDTDTALRGQRTHQIEEMLCALTGAEGALVVNNGASAVFLILNSLSLSKETLISRGELVQIGGGFRMPEILSQSGAILKEVGTTNITEVRDYEMGASEKTALVLKVHPSCFSVTGHTHAPSLSSLAETAHTRGLPLAVDWGSGSLQSRSGGEVSISEILGSGCDLLSFSGDKLFGASQAGLIVGKKEWIERLKKSPLYRALRIGKLDLFVLERTLRVHLGGDSSLVDQLLTSPLEKLLERSNRLCSALQKMGVPARTAPGKSPVGGGSTPTEELESVFIQIEVGNSEEAARNLSAFHTPIFVRKEKGVIALDLRTVFPADEALLLEGLSCLF